VTLTTIELVNTDLTTVLFDLHSATGATNSSWGSVITKFGLGGSFKVQAPLDAERFEHPGFDGGFTTFSRRGLGTAEWRQAIAGTTEANLRLGVGRFTDLITSGTILRIVTSTTTRYLRLEPSAYPAPFAGKELELHDIFQQSSFRQGLDVSTTCQPYWEGAEIATSAVTVPNDPATSTKVRVFPITVSGDLPTQGRVRVKMDTGSAVERILIASRALKSNPSSWFADYLSDTGFFQANTTERGWTVTSDVDTAATTDVNASPGSGNTISRITHATTPTVNQRRVSYTRTTKIDSLRGSWDVWVRVKAAAARDYRLQLRWGPATTEPPDFTLPAVAHNTAALGTPPTFGYVEVNLGRIYIPEQVLTPYGGLRFELWTRLASGAAANLDVDLFWFVPTSSSTIVVPTVATSGGSVTGGELVTPVSNPAGGTAGSASGNPDWLNLDTTTDNAGTDPNAGMVLAPGRWRASFYVRIPTTVTLVIRARNITDSTSPASRTVTGTGSFETYTLDFTAVAGKLYQFQLDDPSSVGLVTTIESVSWNYIPSLVSGESARTEPGRPAVDRLDASANLNGYLGVEGMVPVVLQPGDNHIMIRCDEVPLEGYSEGENKLARTPDVSVKYWPRYAL
jgi:hypothetical protein